MLPYGNHLKCAVSYHVTACEVATELACGCVGGTVGVLLTYPIDGQCQDEVKTRLQAGMAFLSLPALHLY